MLNNGAAWVVGRAGRSGRRLAIRVKLPSSRQSWVVSCCKLRLARGAPACVSERDSSDWTASNAFVRRSARVMRTDIL